MSGVLGQRRTYTGFSDSSNPHGTAGGHAEPSEGLNMNAIIAPIVKTRSKELHQRFWQFHQGRVRYPDNDTSGNYTLRLPVNDATDTFKLNKVDAGTVTTSDVAAASNGVYNENPVDQTTQLQVDKSLNMSNANDLGLVGLRLDMFHMIHTIPNIDARQGNIMDQTASTAFIEYYYNGAATRVSLPQGYYKAQDMIDLLQTSLDSVTTSKVVVTIDTLRAKVKFVTTLGGNTLYFTSYTEEQEDDCNRTPRTMLGLPPGYDTNRVTMTGSNTYYGYQCIDVLRPKQLVARLIKKNATRLTDLSQDNLPLTTDAIASMPLDVPFGSNFIWRAPPQQPTVMVQINEKINENTNFALYLVDERGYNLITGRQEFGGCGVVIYSTI